MIDVFLRLCAEKSCTHFRDKFLIALILVVYGGMVFCWICEAGLLGGRSKNKQLAAVATL